MNTRSFLTAVRRLNPGGPVPYRWRLTERQRRLVYLWVAAIGAGSQLFTALALAVTGAHTPIWWPLAGSVICLAAWSLLWTRRIPWQWVDSGILAAASALVGTQLALQQGPLTADILFGCVFLLLAGFSILPLAQAALYLIGVLVAVGLALLVHGGPYALFWNVALAGVLAAHLSTFGRNISVERAEANAFEALANTDVLTGLENRRAMLVRVQTAFTQAPRPALLLVDVDRFKRINDRFGHDVGDRVLQDVATCLTQTVGPDGHVARWGGEEFLVLLEDGDGQATATSLLTRVRQDVSWNGATVTISVGGVTCAEVETVDEWLRLADARLYEAKNGGRNRAELDRPQLWEVRGYTLG
ncbi:diguanylate cyclase [Deinococcus soli (ex Cha et al. 2016)]|uniref:Diguanylate cyclase (GGDEF)-like protein n=2 Tax=Deinococcus soli (ex Cha et al. 2016) TaxID=1309411 RepID=A0AAE3XI24_9DEIO|nr:sensor domain-containing diguanylate cyclase [Deinococcus soli (ex Cha et al. 2016)]MDR6220854.1 diguanylate cyclase (GGDEF)-like protein [Deinococcus soli (ex Cha et al. 2016)]MDR6330848.1 diguanylate cyclase (GGDEF)-like protein [Deinococcus soli (ex Cha et al. 2016)]MDR6753953.1 diguanylate cyclase (GGDEF)-like protein [Deinococcus soli (ex Cha et al. 2016)]GGB81433.1 GGDEF domain-containing protein [Deinococcus soli (ex Cha et al. 2016)]